MDASGFNFGVDAQELVLILVSFAAQHDFFELLHTPNNMLGWLAYTFGLIGFVSLLLLPANWTGKVILPWLFLMIIIVARPLGEPFFFTDPITSSSSVMSQPVCAGNLMNQKECKQIMGDGEGITVKDTLEAKDSMPASSFKMFSPIAATIHVINELHEGIAVELSGFGGNVVNNHLTAIETVRRSATANIHATYALANFQATCGRKNPHFAKLAALSSANALEHNEETMRAMKKTPLTAADGLILFENYVNFGERGESFVPPLICGAGVDAEPCVDNAYDRTSGAGRAIDLDEIFGNKTILYKSQDDLSRVMVRPEETEGAVDAPAESDEGKMFNRQRVGVEEVSFNLENRTFAKLGGDYQPLRDQKVSIVFPTNTRAILKERYGDIDGYEDELSQVIGEIEQISLESWQKTGTAVGVGVGLGLATLALVLGAAACNLFCVVLAALVGVAGGIAGHGMADNYARFKTEQLEGRAVELAEKGVIVSVDNCADLHAFTSLQLSVSTVNFSFARAELKELLEENKDLLIEHGNDLMGLPARERMDILLTSVRERDMAACEEREDGSFFNPISSTVIESDAACKNRIDEKISKLQNILRAESVNMSSAATAAYLDEAGDVKFSGEGFQLVSNIGEVAAPVGIWFKTILGGFGAGTYSYIMPILVSYATALMIIMTPLLFMIGLAVPTWAGGVILLPIIVVGYFQLTKVIFTMIGIISGVFIASRDAGLITGMASGFADLIMATAYTSAFLLTGIIMFALKNPFGAVQKVAGGADQASTISSQQALQMAGAAYGVSQIPGKASAMSQGLEKALGNASANLEANTGIKTSAVLSDDMQLHRGKRLGEIAQQQAQAEHYSKMSAEDFNKHASGVLAQSKQKEIMETAHAADNDHFFDKYTGRVMQNGELVPTGKTDNAYKSLKNAAKDAGQEFSSEISKAVLGVKGIGGKVNKDLLNHEGTVAYDFDPEKLRGTLESKGVNVDQMIEKGTLKQETVTDRQGNKQDVLRVVEHQGPGRDAVAGKGGGGSSGGGGSDIRDRIKSSADRNKPNRPKGGSDDNS